MNNTAPQEPYDFLTEPVGETSGAGSVQAATKLSRSAKLITVLRTTCGQIIDTTSRGIRSCTSRASNGLSALGYRTWRNASVDTIDRVLAGVRSQPKRGVIIALLLGAAIFSTAGVPLFGPSTMPGIWPLQILGVIAIWVGLTVPLARNYSLQDMITAAGSDANGEAKNLFWPSAILLSFGAATYISSALIIGSGNGSWGLFKTLVFFCVSAIATATLSIETANATACEAAAENTRSGNDLDS